MRVTSDKGISNNHLRLSNRAIVFAFWHWVVRVWHWLVVLRWLVCKLVGTVVQCSQNGNNNNNSAKQTKTHSNQPNNHGSCILTDEHPKDSASTRLSQPRKDCGGKSYQVAAGRCPQRPASAWIDTSRHSAQQVLYAHLYIHFLLSLSDPMFGLEDTVRNTFTAVVLSPRLHWRSTATMAKSKADEKAGPETCVFLLTYTYM